MVASQSTLTQKRWSWASKVLREEQVLQEILFLLDGWFCIPCLWKHISFMQEGLKKYNLKWKLSWHETGEQKWMLFDQSSWQNVIKQINRRRAVNLVCIPKEVKVYVSFFMSVSILLRPAWQIARIWCQISVRQAEQGFWHFSSWIHNFVYCITIFTLLRGWPFLSIL
jgi:hypothetical protein